MRVSRVLLILLVALLCAAGLYLVFTLHDGAAGTGTAGAKQIRINEIMTSNKGTVPDENGNYPDWVELYNGSDSAVNISGYGLSDDKLAAAKWVFPAGTTIPAKGYIVVFCSGEAKAGTLHASFKLSATDDLILSNATGHAIDSLALTSVTANATLGRDEATGEWKEMLSPSPGFPNTEEGAAQFRSTLQQNAQDNGVRINEFMASNATTLPGPDGDYPDWIELYNTTNADVDLSGCGLSDDAGQPMKWFFPDGTIIPAKGVLLVYCSGREGLIDGALNAPFGLRSYAEDVVLADKNGGVIDSYSYTQQQADQSMARVPDGSGEWEMTAQPTPGFPNTDEGFAAFASTSALPTGAVMLSEVLGNNAASYTYNGASPDWIELYNRSNEAVNLAGYALSDNPKNPALWVFPDVTIGAGEYMVVAASGLDVRDTQKKTLETNFSLSADGEVVLLFSPTGELLDKLQLPSAGVDVSFGRTDGALRYYDDPTPGAANGPGAAGVTVQPQFSVLPGIYTSAIELELTADASAKIYYTTNCTEPTSASTPYTGPIHIEKNTVVRAVALREGFLPGMSSTGTYLFTSDGVNHALPVATLVTDPDNLWDSKTGIYAFGENYDPDLPYGDSLLTANFYQGRGIQGEEVQTAWERPASFAVFGDESNTQEFSQNISIRIAGAYGRGRAQKGFNIIARSEYGDSRMAYAFFDNRPYTEYKSLVLRAGAQDQNRGKIRDELATGLLEGTDVRFFYQAYKPYVLYLNGEYWGVYFLKEKRSRFFVAQHEGTENTEDMDLLKSSSLISHGSNAEWKELMNYVKTHDLSNAENYRYVEERLDTGSFMDYMICELYVGNSDYGNIQYYKLPGGKWKWVYYDFCWGWSNVNHQTVTLRRGATPAASDLFNAMLQNSAWRDAFCRRFAQLMETVYAPDRVNALIDELYAAVEPEIRREREKFNGPTFMGMAQKDEVRGSYDSFLSNIEAIRKFAQERPAVIKAQLKSELGLSDSYMQEVFG